MNPRMRTRKGMRTLKSRPHVDEIGCNRRALIKRGITASVNVTKDQPCVFEKYYTYHRVPIDDGDANISDHFGPVKNFINRHKVVFVHCLEGRSRSASLVIYYLMKIYGWDYQTSRHYVKQRREIISPHFNFEIALRTL